MKNTEFSNSDGNVFYKGKDGIPYRLTQDSSDVIEAILCKFQELYPGAVGRCKEIWKSSKPNLPYYNYRIAERLCACNLGVADEHAIDFDEEGELHLEHVQCPKRGGHCEDENVICHPVLNTVLSTTEMTVLRLLYKGLDRQRIADDLCRSVNTINCHIANMRAKLDLPSQAGLISYAAKHGLIENK